MKKYLKLIRVKHWVKNFLILLPLIFSGNLLVPKYYFSIFLGFTSFSFIASIVYILNDIQDIEKDRLHPKKKERPLAKGIISIKNAYIIMAIMFMTSVGIVFFLSTKMNVLYISLVLVGYLITNILYSKWLKNIAIIDVVILVSGFLLRVLYGSLLTKIPISNWLYLMIIFSAFYLGFGKRRNEFNRHKEENTRKVLEKYNHEFLDKNMYLCAALSIMCYSLWCLDQNTILRTGSNLLVWSIPLLMIVFFRYSLNIEGDSDGDPTDVILGDKMLLAMIFVYASYMFITLYVL